MDKIRCAVVGLGYWGPNLVRNIATLPSTELVAICDSKSSRLELLSAQYHRVRAIRDYADVVSDPGIDAVFIATPVSAHFSVALAALKAGKHVFIEKPMSATVEEAARLVEEAEKRRCVLMVDHVFAYTPAVRRMRRLIDEGAIGELYYYDSARINLGLFQSDVNVIWDLAVHDIAIMDYLIDERPSAVSAVAAAHVQGRPENIAYLTCFFPSGLIAHVHVNWLAPVKVRHTIVGGSRKMIVYDDLEPDEKVKIYDRGIDQENNSNPLLQLGYRLGDMWAPMLDRTEALANAVQHFADCVRNGAAPNTDGRCGLRVVKLLDSATRSTVMRGQPVDLGS